MSLLALLPSVLPPSVQQRMAAARQAEEAVLLGQIQVCGVVCVVVVWGIVLTVLTVRAGRASPPSPCMPGMVRCGAVTWHGMAWHAGCGCMQAQAAAVAAARYRAHG